jgi:DNA-binding protein H-NS
MKGPHLMATKSKLPNLESLSIEELLTLQKDVEKQIKKTQRANKKATIKKMDDMAKKAGYSSAAEMLGATAGGSASNKKDKATKAPPKYKDPNSEKTWTGAGRVPGWMLDYEKKKGKKRDDLLIRK